MAKLQKKPKTAQKLKRAKKQQANLSRQLEIETALQQATDPDTIRYLQTELEKTKSDGVNRIRSTVTEFNGVKYRSSLEAYFAEKCYENNIPFVTQQDVILQEEFYLFNQRVPKIGIRVDFLVAGFAFVDPKGMLMPDFEVKWKMLQNKFREDYEYYLPRNKKEICDLVEDLKNKLEL